MNPLKFETGAGATFSTVARDAQKVSIANEMPVEFEFNGVICLVNESTNLEWLYRDYANSWRMEWKTVGPNCLEVYVPEVQTELDKRNKIAEEKQRIRDEELAAKDKAEREAYELKTKGITMDISNQELWESGLAKNTDTYGHCCYEYAEAWAKLMQSEISNGKTLIDCAQKTSYELGFFGITGYMYGAAVHILAGCWKHGEDLRKWHNGEYGKADSKGVVNPAVLTIG